MATEFFPAEPRRVDVDERSLDLVFEARHEAGGRSKASVLVRRNQVDQTWVVELARTRAAEFCQLHGGGSASSVSVLMAL